MQNAVVTRVHQGGHAVSSDLPVWRERWSTWTWRRRFTWAAARTIPRSCWPPPASACWRPRAADPVPEHGYEVQQLLGRLTQAHVPSQVPEVAGHNQPRQLQAMLSRAETPESTELRQATSALLRASWYLLETMGLEPLAPSRLHQAIEKSTIYAEL